MTTTGNAAPALPDARQERSAPAPSGARRTRTTVTLGPFLVALTEQDRRERRPTVLIALAYIAPDDPGRGTDVATAVQQRLAAAVESVPLTDLRGVAEALFDAFAQPVWPRADGAVVEHGIRISQIAVSLLPRDPSGGQVQPVATVSVADPELTAA